MKPETIDPITLSTVWNSFQSMGREMRYVIDRTAQNYLIAQLHDMAAGIWDAQARTIAVPEGPTSMFLSQQFSVEYILDKFGDDLHPGDVIICNDPYKGYCNHLPDWGFFRPIFYEGELVFVALTRGHQMDTGGAFPGGYFPNGYDIHAEGLMIPPTKIYDRGRERTDVLELIWNNVRWPDGVKIDNYALMAALQVCDNRIVTLLDKYGVPTVKDAVEEMLDRMEANVRAQLAEVPDGTYYGESATDDDGTVLDELVWVRCAATIKGDELILDFSESDAQRRGFVNCVYSSTYSRAVAGSFLYFDPAFSEFHNDGSMRPITVIAPEGSVCNAQYPATVGGSPVNVGTQVLEATVGPPAGPLHRRRRSPYRRTLRADNHRRGRRLGSRLGLRRVRGGDGNVRPRLDTARQRGGGRDPVSLAGGSLPLRSRHVRRRPLARRLRNAVGGGERRRGRGSGHRQLGR